MLLGIWLLGTTFWCGLSKHQAATAQMGAWHAEFSLRIKRHIVECRHPLGALSFPAIRYYDYYYYCHYHYYNYYYDYSYYYYYQLLATTYYYYNYYDYDYDYYCTKPHYTILHYTTLHCTALHYTILYYTILHNITQYTNNT